MTRIDLPFELWRTIFQDVYAAKTDISHPPLCEFVISKLQSRLNIYRCLASVSKSWRLNARHVFFEDLQVHTIEALQGLIKLFRSNDVGRELASVVSRLDFSFPEFRCSAGNPRRPRPLISEPAPINGAAPPSNDRSRRRGCFIGFNEPASSSHPTQSPHRELLYRKTAQKYRPTDPACQWASWQENVANLVKMCSSASHVAIRFTSSLVPIVPSSLPSPFNGFITKALSKTTNLKSLNLLDPTPLQVFGRAFGELERLEYLHITLTTRAQELPNTAAKVILPKSLRILSFDDLSYSGNLSWNISSSTGKRTYLLILDLGVSYNNAVIMKAIALLCSSCQHTLRTLILRAFQRTNRISGSHPINSNITFHDVFYCGSNPFHFINLEHLHIPNGVYDISLFGSFKADKLKLVEVGGLTVTPDMGTVEKKWSAGLHYSSLQALSQLIINSKDPVPVLSSVCKERGVRLRTGLRLVRDTSDM